jgi:hypothetical protein
MFHVEQDTALAIADLRQQLGELRSALGVTGDDGAEAEVQRLRTVVQELADGLQDFLGALSGAAPATPETAAAEVAQLKATVAALASWAALQPVPFNPPAAGP